VTAIVPIVCDFCDVSGENDEGYAIRWVKKWMQGESNKYDNGN
jgi:hypothetical protein